MAFGTGHTPAFSVSYEPKPHNPLKLTHRIAEKLQIIERAFELLLRGSLFCCCFNGDAPCPSLNAAHLTHFNFCGLDTCVLTAMHLQAVRQLHQECLSHVIAQC